jgi:hypothetical protein
MLVQRSQVPDVELTHEDDLCIEISFDLLAAAFVRTHLEQRAFAMPMYRSEMSMPTYRLPCAIAATIVEPVPQKGSITIPPDGHVARIGIRQS